MTKEMTDDDAIVDIKPDKPCAGAEARRDKLYKDSTQPMMMQLDITAGKEGARDSAIMDDGAAAAPVDPRKRVFRGAASAGRPLQQGLHRWSLHCSAFQAARRGCAVELVRTFLHLHALSMITTRYASIYLNNAALIILRIHTDSLHTEYLYTVSCKSDLAAHLSPNKSGPSAFNPYTTIYSVPYISFNS